MILLWPIVTPIVAYYAGVSTMVALAVASRIVQ
jgi:hypothetical protein